MNEKIYNKDNPFFASIKEKRLLSSPGSNRKTFHCVLDLTGSHLTYEPGDSLGIYPRHDPLLIQKTLEAMKATGQEKVALKNSNGEISFEDFLKTKANITSISAKFFQAVMERQTDTSKRDFLKELLTENLREEFKKFQEEYQIWDFLRQHPEVTFSPQEFVDYLMPLLPRFYSISSSQKQFKDEVHLTIAALEYESNGHKRKGVCTHFLTDIVKEKEEMVPLFIQSSHGFRLPEDPHNTSIIMIGPGTGIAPFRAFLQERLMHDRSRGKHWLFFGEQQRSHDFYYESDWEALKQLGHLDVDVAFSRDQKEKVYVQHKMLEKAPVIYEWLEAGAYLYVCGDAQKMAKDVEKTLLDIVQECGKKDAMEAREYIKQMRKQKRYLRDVY